MYLDNQEAQPGEAEKGSRGGCSRGLPTGRGGSCSWRKKRPGGLDHDHVGTEHILLGLVLEGEGVAARALESLGISLQAVREEVEESIGRGPAGATGAYPLYAAGQEDAGALAA